MKTTNIIREKSFVFALEIIKLYSSLQKDKEFVISKQVLRSGTSIGANIEEAQAGQSRKDFLSKMSIASKEARETKYWLQLLNMSKLTNVNLSRYLEAIDEITKILSKIVLSVSQS